MKIVALGFIYGQKSYLRFAWNIMDLVIVIASLIEIVSYYSPNVNFGFNMRVLRVLRILRPLKAMKTIPSLRKQIMALLASVKGLLNVGVFLLFILLLFGIIGLHWFQGTMHYACRVGLPTNTTWYKYSDFNQK